MFVICFISQWMKRSKHGLFVFSPKKTLIWRRHYSTGQSCWSMTSKRSLDWFLESSWARSFFTRESLITNQKPRTFIPVPDKAIKSLYFHLFVVSVLFCQSINQSFISTRYVKELKNSFKKFCSRVFISRSYEIALTNIVVVISNVDKTNSISPCS